MSGLRAAMDAGLANLIFRVRGKGAEPGRQVVHISADADLEVIRALHAEIVGDADIFAYFSMDAGRVYGIDELLEIDFAEQVRALHEFVRRAGLKGLRIARIEDGRGRSAWITVAQPRRGNDFTPERVDLLAALLPHFALSLRSYGLIEEISVNAEVAARLAGAFNQACILLDDDGKVRHFENQAAELVQADGWPALRIGAPLKTGDRRLDRLVAQWLQALAEPSAKTELALSTDGHCELLLVELGAKLSPQSHMPAVAAFIGHKTPGRPRLRGAAALGAAWGLTPREAELTLLLAGGLSLAEAARHLSISEQTVRFYSKRIYSKTGAHGQVDLVRRVLTSVVALT